MIPYAQMLQEINEGGRWRYYGLTSLRAIFTFFCIGFLAIIGAQVGFGVTKMGNTRSIVDNLALSVIMISAILLFCALIAAYVLARIRQILIFSEFQTFVFSSIVAEPNELCVILDKAGNILYLNQRGYYLLNYSQPKNAEVLLSKLSISAWPMINQVLSEGKSFHTEKLSLTPLRVTSFFLLKVKS